MEPTPTTHDLPLRKANFACLAEALDYAAKGDTGYNFYNSSGKLKTVMPYRALRKEARETARRLMGLKLERGARVAMVAESNPAFMRLFYACQYAGLVAVPLPAAIHIGGRAAYVNNLKRLLATCKADMAMAPDGYLPLLIEAAKDLEIGYVGSPADVDDLPEADAPLMPSEPHELAYLQYTSGSTRFPRGVMITPMVLMNNLSMITRHGLNVREGDRAVSWLPYYHDMGLVGMVLAPMAAQFSVDYLNPRDFAMRPRLWPGLISRNKATLSFSPPFGYELCSTRLRATDIEALDLSSWRVAGLGAEPIRPEPLVRFAAFLEPAGFDRRAFVAGYGMAECTLAVSFSSIGEGLVTDRVDREVLAEFQQAISLDARIKTMPGTGKTFVNCGEPLPGYEYNIRDEHGRPLPERCVGILHVRGPSVMTGYFNDPEASAEVLSPSGWLNTGDLAYQIDRSLVITGREKDMIIINGRNIWPQDIEHLAERQPEVRTGDASAFAVEGPGNSDQAVLVIQCHNVDKALEADLADRVNKSILLDFGIHCIIDLMPRRTLPRTTSGKLSRSRARLDYLQRRHAGDGGQTRGRLYVEPGNRMTAMP